MMIIEKDLRSGSATDSEDPETSDEVRNLPAGLPTVNSRTGKSLNKKRKAKIIRRVLKLRAGNWEEEAPSLYRQLAISYGGLINDLFRRQIWPVLSHSKSDPFASEEESSTENGNYLTAQDRLQHGDSEPETALDAVETILVGVEVDSVDLRSHSDWDQVALDVRRTLARFPPNISDSERAELQDQLTPLIIRVMFENPKFRYYQGFHDVCLTFLLALGAESAFRVTANLCHSGVFPFLTEGVDVIDRELGLIFIILWKTDPDLEQFLRRAGLGTTFALSWYITWFAHVIDEYDKVARLYDLFLASHPLMPIYLSAAIVLYRSEEILRECDCDMAEIHSFLGRTLNELPPLEALISDAQDLFIAHPPSGAAVARIEYENMTRIAEERARHGKLKRSMSWHMGTKREPQPPRTNFAVAFWAVTATAAAWYVYTHSHSLAHWLS